MTLRGTNSPRHTTPEPQKAYFNRAANPPYPAVPPSTPSPQPPPSPASSAMCKHILNAQVSIRSPCCQRWFDCAECHAESETHRLLQRIEMVFACKKCKKCFRKDTSEWDDSDEYCPHCDNHFVIEAKTPQAALRVEGEDIRKDSRMVKDDRIKGERQRGILGLGDDGDKADRLG